MPYKAALFDIDGTLLDTSEFIYQSLEHAIKMHGLTEKSREELKHSVRLEWDELFEHPEKVVDIDAVVQTFVDFQKNNFHLSVAYARTHETLQSLKAAGIKLAAVSSRGRTLHETLQLAGILEYFDSVINPDVVEECKPSPIPLYKALEQMQVDPTEAVMIGDTDVDIIAGKAAGTKTIGVSYGWHADLMANYEPDYIVDDIADIIPIIVTSKEIVYEQTT